jgi:small subunit ribosomal protein S16
MLIIRLQRAGKRNKPEFRIVLAEKERSAEKKFTEILGHYNPRTKDFTVKEDRLQYWVSQHVSLSPTVHNLFVTKKLIDGAKVKAFSIPKKEEPAAEATPTPAEAPAAESAAEAAAEPTAEAAPAPAPEPVAEAPAAEATPEATSEKA